MKAFMESNNSEVPDVSYGRSMALFNYVSLSVPESKYSALPTFQQFEIVLMKLRLNVADKTLLHISLSLLFSTFKKDKNIIRIPETSYHGLDMKKL